ncbi:MAG: hypothetical protein H6719_12955 [Sandaracinaceae bacterium]|nr:hypothetical protein [Sandaracinaceae bacterium]
MTKRIALAAALVLLAGCGDEGGSLSRTQRAFLEARGAPTAFAILFSDADLDESGLAVATPARRVETWIYAGAPARRIVFDSGYFVDEVDLTADLDADPAAASPADFDPAMTRADVEAALGAPDRVEEQDLGGQALVMLRYDAPEVVSVAFLDGHLASVVAGMQVQP